MIHSCEKLCSDAIVCYAINDPASYSNVSQKWIPEIHPHCPTASIIVVGTKNDLRENVGDENIKRTAALKEQANDGCHYLECSSLSCQGLKEVFEKVTDLALTQLQFQYLFQS